MTRRLLMVEVLLVAAAACAGNASAPTTSSNQVLCLDTPSTERELRSSLAMVLDPNPVAAGALATLTVGGPGQPAYEYIDGASAQWQCWDGSGWIDTYVLIRGFSSAGPQALEITPGTTITIPAIGLPVPNSYTVVIPPVPPGTYRIVDQVGGPSRARLGGFVIVEVR